MSSDNLKLSQIKETCLYVQDLDRTSNFYHDLLELPIIGRAENRHVFFRVGDDVLLCFIAETTKKESRFPSHFATGKQHLAFSVNRSQYNDWKEKIERLDIAITCEYEWRENVWSFYFEDPDGHVLEIVPDDFWDY